MPTRAVRSGSTQPVQDAEAEPLRASVMRGDRWCIAQRGRRKGLGVNSPGPYSCPIHRSAYNGCSRKSVCRILHKAELRRPSDGPPRLSSAEGRPQHLVALHKESSRRIEDDPKAGSPALRASPTSGVCCRPGSRAEPFGGNPGSAGYAPVIAPARALGIPVAGARAPRGGPSSPARFRAPCPARRCP
jgi:hypothetical protein